MNIFSLRNISILVAVISGAVIVAALVVPDLNKSFFLAIIFNNAKEFVVSSTITSNIMPIGYAGFLGICIGVGSEESIPLCQAFIYAGGLFAGLWVLYLRGVKGGLLLLGMLAIAVHPVFLANVWRIHDGNLTVFLLFAFLALTIYTSRTKSVWSALFLGVVTGALFTVRANAVIIVLPALFLLSFARQKTVKNLSVNTIKTAALFLFAATIVFVSINLVIKQKPIFTPDHGYYNLFSGANEYSAKYLKEDYSGENSHVPALQALGYAVNDFTDQLAFPAETYKKLAIEYVREHPWEYSKLSALKLLTLFRPGYHVPEGFEWLSAHGVKRVVKIVLALPFFVWLIVLYIDRKNFKNKENLFVFLVTALYLLPFFIANADPRYRFPIDIVLIADIFCHLQNLTLFKRRV